MTIITYNFLPHEPIEECGNHHCHSHGVDEWADDAFIACYECGHVYRTGRELRRAYRRAAWRSARQFRQFTPWWRWPSVVLHIALRRARDIDFCQHCIHDF